MYVGACSRQEIEHLSFAAARVFHQQARVYLSGSEDRSGLDLRAGGGWASRNAASTRLVVVTLPGHTSHFEVTSTKVQLR